MKVDKWFHMYSKKKEIVFEEADPTKVQWIPISERKPELYEPVAICSESGRFHVGSYIDFAKWVIDGVQMYVDELGDFWWMPFPEPPKGDTNGDY